MKDYKCMAPWLQPESRLDSSKLASRNLSFSLSVLRLHNAVYLKTILMVTKPFNFPMSLCIPFRFLLNY